MDDVRKDVANLLGININANSPITNQNENNIPNMMLQKGMKNNQQVQLLQEKLIELGYNLGQDGADGNFGQITELAVKTFQ
jgi:peptidoglycan hydrolase-like protein with peptidoglycan-binding domain